MPDTHDRDVATSSTVAAPELPRGVAVTGGDLTSWLVGQPAEQRVHVLLGLQRGVGNAAISRALAPPVQPDTARRDQPSAGETADADRKERHDESHGADVEAAVQAAGDGAWSPNSAAGGAAPAVADSALDDGVGTAGAEDVMTESPGSPPDSAVAGPAGPALPPVDRGAAAPVGGDVPLAGAAAEPVDGAATTPGVGISPPISATGQATGAPLMSAGVADAAPGPPRSAPRWVDAIGGQPPAGAAGQARPPAAAPAPPAPSAAAAKVAVGAGAESPVDLAAAVRARGGPQQGESPIATAARAALAAGLDQLSEAAQTSIAAIHSRAETEATRIGETAVAAAAEVDDAARAAQETITGHAAAEREGLHGSAATQSAAVAQWHVGATAGAHDALTAHAQRAQSLGSDHGAQAATAGDTVATRIQADTAGAADRSRSAAAHSGGNEATGPPKAEVSSRVAGPAADALHGEGAQAASSVRGQMGQAANTFQTRGAEASGAILGMLAPVGDALSKTAQKSTATIHEAADHGSAALTEGENQARAHVGTQAAEVRGQLADGAAAKQAELIQAGEQLANQVRGQAQQLADAATAHIDDLIAAIPSLPEDDPATASADPDVEHDAGGDEAPAKSIEDPAAEHAAAAGELEQQILTAFAGAAQEHVASTEQAGRSITEAAAEAQQTIRGIPQATSRDLQTATTGVTREMSGGAAKVRGALTQVPQQAKTTGEAVVAAASTKAADTVNQTGTAMSQGLADMRQRGDQQAAGVADRGQAVAGQVSANVATGHERIDDKAKKSEHRSLLGKIVDWVEEQLSDLWEMVKNPGFWVGLLITVVLGGLAVFFLGPYALLLLPFITALAAGAGQLTNNLVAGKGAWDGVWDAVVEGFVGGAIFAAAIGLGIWAGLGTAAMLAVVEVTTVIVTVGSNLLHGERPTKNLLANMLFAWLLDRVGGRVARGRGGPPETKPPVETKPPTETKPPVETKPPTETKPPVDGKPPESNRPPAVPERPPPSPTRPPPEPERPPPDPERPPPEPAPTADPWAGVQRRHPGLTENHVAMLRETGVEPAMADRCLSRGITADQLVLRSIEGGPKAVEIMDGLLSGKGAAKVDARAANRIAELARPLDEIFPGQGLLDAVHKLATSGSLRNPASLRPLMEAINTGDANKIVELNVAAERAGPGADVQLGAINRSGADVVDHVAQEAIQMKNITSADDRAVVANLTDATNQLAGKGASGQRTPGEPGTEVPPNKPDGQPYTRTAELFIRDAENSLFNADRAAIDAFVRGTLKDAVNRASVDQVRIHNGNPASPFTIVGPF